MPKETWWQILDWYIIFASLLALKNGIYIFVHAHQYIPYAYLIDCTKHSLNNVMWRTDSNIKSKIHNTLLEQLKYVKWYNMYDIW